MRRVINIKVFALSTLSLFAILNLSGHQTSSVRHQKPPDVRAVEFYRWYLHSLEEDREPWTDGKKELSRYVSKPLMSELERSLGAGAEEDYFIKAQDYLDDWSKSVRSSDLKTDGRSSTVIISMGTKKDSSVSFAVTFILEGGEWKIRSVKTATVKRMK